jgi:acyl-CoA thioester hydrolase
VIHQTELKVRFYELDPYDHVNHTAYFGYFETARVEALDSIGWAIQRLKELGVHIVVTDMKARFLTPAVSGDVLAIATEVFEIGRASSRWRQAMSRGEDTVAELEVRGATIDVDGRPCRFPAGMEEALEGLKRS